jgi:cysteinyl-tRNA synthetase
MIKIYNTFSGTVEPFAPGEGNTVRMYVCGITPYDVCHLGHARCYVAFDIIRRVLKAEGYNVRFVQNFTDVDDKIIARAREKGQTTTEIARQNIDDFFNKMDALGIQRAEVYPRVTEHIPDIQNLIRRLIEIKAAYVLGGDVYYSIKAFPQYGKLSKRPLEEMQAGARVDVNKDKHDPLDFALWKAAKPEDPPEALWDSPWGRGRPGWHIECSVMALKHLGPKFDIHGGGLDLIFPHHENEIAQSEAATGAPFARVWIHNGFVTVNKEKMSKSLGNFFSLSDIFERFHPAVVRYMLLTVHYRSPLNFSEDLLQQSREARANLMDTIARATFLIRKQSRVMESADKPAPEEFVTTQKAVEEFREALRDDFNTPEALGVLHQLAGQLEKEFSGNQVQIGSVRCILDGLKEMSHLLGLDLFSFMQSLFISPEVTELSNRREEARGRKDWKEADRLRQAILEHGYTVEDTPQGPRLLPRAGS